MLVVVVFMSRKQFGRQQWGNSRRDKANDHTVYNKLVILGIGEGFVDGTQKDIHKARTDQTQNKSYNRQFEFLGSSQTNFNENAHAF